MEQVTRGGGRGEAVRVGVDLAKRVIQVHAVDGGDRVLTSRALRREQFLEWCVRLPAGCMVAMEASSSAHHWARKLIALGLDARILSAPLVSPYRQEGMTGKNDANDAAAICEAASRPRMRFIPVKSIEQQSMLYVHRLRGTARSSVPGSGSPRASTPAAARTTWVATPKRGDTLPAHAADPSGR